MEPNNYQDIKLKDCYVLLKKVPIMVESSSDSEDELPRLPFMNSVTRRKVRSKKSSADLLKEHQNLVQNLKAENTFEICVQETTRKLEAVELEVVNERLSASPDPILSEESGVKILCVKNSLQFFGTHDVTPAQCGYDKRCHDSFPVQKYEQQMLSFKRVEFEHVISSFFYSSKEGCISDLKAFATFLLRSLSIQRDTGRTVCYETLVSLLDTHPDSYCLTFNSAEIFMLLFNYGVDVDSFKFYSKWTDLKNNLEVPQYQKKDSTKIPDTWLFNLKFILKAIKSATSCTFEAEDMEKIIIFLMWMSTDSFLMREHFYFTIRDCMYTCIENIRENVWSKTQCNIVNALLSLEFSTMQEKWSTIHDMVESIPNRGRALKLRKQLSFSSLKYMCLGTAQDLDEDGLGFCVNELQFIIKQLNEINIELLPFATKFLDYCLHEIGASEEEYITLCNLLVQCRNSLSDAARNEKTHIDIIYAKLGIFCGQKVSLHKKSSICNVVHIKSENQDSNDISYQKSPYNSDEKEDTPALSEDSHSSITTIKSEYVDESPNLLNDSQSCSTNQSASSKGSSYICIKTEQADNLDDPVSVKKVSPLKIVKRKSSSGSSFMGPSVETDDLNCNDDNMPNQSPDFEYHLPNEDAGENSAIIQSSAGNLTISSISIEQEPIIFSDISIEYPEETFSAIKIEPESYYDDTTVVEKIDIVEDNINKDNLPSTSESYENQNFFIDDGPRIAEVKSIPLNDMESTGNSTVLTSNLHSEMPDVTQMTEQQSTVFKVPFTEHNMPPDCDTPLLYSESTTEINTYGGVLNESSSVQENTDAVTLKQITSVTLSTDKNNLLNTDGDVVLLNTEDNVLLNTNENVLLNTDEDVVLLNNDVLLNTDEDIVFIEEKISPKNSSKKNISEENIPSPVQKYSDAHPELSITPVKNKVHTSIACKNNCADNEDIVIIEEKTPVKKNDDITIMKKVFSSSISKPSTSPKIKQRTDAERISAKFHIPPQIEVVPCATNIESEENNSDNDICIVDVIEKNTTDISKEDKTENITNDVLSLDDKSVGNVSPTHQCREILTNVLNQVGSNKNTVDLQCNEILNSLVECIGVNMNSVTNDSELITNSKNDPNIGISTHSSTLESSLEKKQNNIDESKKTTIFLPTLNSSKKFVNDTSVLNGNACFNSDEISNSVDKNYNGSFKNDVVNEISTSNKDVGVDIDRTSKNFLIDQGGDSNTIFDIMNESLKHIEADYTTENQNTTFVSNTPVTDCTMLVADQNPLLEAVQPHSSACIISVKPCDTNVSDKNETEGKSINKLTTSILDTSSKDNTVPYVNSSEESVLQNEDKNCTTFKRCEENFRKPLKRSGHKKKMLKNSKVFIDELLYKARKTVPKRKQPCVTFGGVAKKSFENKPEIETLKIVRKPSHKTSFSNYITPSSRIRRKRSWSNSHDENIGDLTSRPRKSPRKYSPVKSPLSAKYCNQKSPNPFFNYSSARQKLKNCNRPLLFSRPSANISNVLREQDASTSNRVINSVDIDDSDVIHLYTDPKRWADKECIVLYETEDIVIVD